MRFLHFAKEVANHLLPAKGGKDAVTFDVVRLIFVVAMDGAFLLPFLRQPDELGKDRFGAADLPQKDLGCLRLVGAVGRKIFAGEGEDATQLPFQLAVARFRRPGGFSPFFSTWA